MRKRRHQHRITPFEQRQAALLFQRQQLGERSPFEEVEEVRLVVGGRLDVELVVLQEFPAARTGAVYVLLLAKVRDIPYHGVRNMS